MIYCIFLRGINTGKLKLTNEDFYKLLQNAGCHQIKTIQAAGTAVFSFSDTSPDKIRTLIEEQLAQYFGKRIPSVLRNKEQIDRITSEVTPLKSSPEFHDYIMLTDDAYVYSEAVKLHETIPYLSGERIIDGVDYFLWTTPKGSSLGDFGGKVLGSKSFKERLTSRNFNTIMKVAEEMAKIS